MFETTLKGWLFHAACDPTLLSALALLWLDERLKCQARLQGGGINIARNSMVYLITCIICLNTATHVSRFPDS